MATLTPRLTPLDERVLSAVPEDGRAVRAGDVAVTAFGQRRWRCEQCGREAACDSYGARPSAHERGVAIGCLDCHKRSGWTSRDRTMRPIRVASPEDTQMTREVLRGLQRIGLLRCGRGGWWRRP